MISVFQSLTNSQSCKMLLHLTKCSLSAYMGAVSLFFLNFLLVFNDKSDIAINISEVVPKL